MEITPPFGYGRIVPLEKHHRVLLPNLPAAGGGVVAAFAGRMNAMPISFAEFAAAGRDHPIIFTSAEDGAYMPLALLGLSDDRNLHVADGHWIACSYVPA
ncbi:MAG TPA: SapC family protein, partial [Burkholderiales bacterium]|nr:SapC family protein [Burkholderiales bacterium]